MTGDQVTALVADDGHVLMIASGGNATADLLGFKALLDELGVTGWRVDGAMDQEAAVGAGLARDGCTACGPWLPCGCGLAMAGGGVCPHGGREAIAAARARLGWA
jgi:hypothetical protein